ncbi:ABC transporter permease subunit [archaeon]|nr:ABC transporter permease subunit [archaeon]
MFSFFDQNGFTLRAFEKIFFPGQVSLFGTTALFSIALSLGLALFASIIATILGLIASLKQTKVFFVNIFVGSSIAVSIITLAFGYFLGFGSGEIWIIAIGHSILAFPFAYRVLNNAVSKIDQESIDSAKTLGANDFQIFRKIQFPRIRNSLFVSLAFSFAISLGELGLVLVLYDGIYATMPIYIYRLLSTFDLPAATGMGIILVSISFLSFYIIEYFSKDAQVF